MLPQSKLAGDSLEQKTAWLEPFSVLRQTCYHPRTTPVDSPIRSMAEESWEGATGRGLDPAVITRRSLEQTPDRSFDLESGLGVSFYPFTLQSFASKKSLP